MFHVEELTIKHLNHKITVVNVKKNEGPTGRTNGLGLLYMGFRSMFQNRPQLSISGSGDGTSVDDEKQCDEGVQTLLDTSVLKLLAPKETTQCTAEVQTDVSVPYWVFSSNLQSSNMFGSPSHCALPDMPHHDRSSSSVAVPLNTSMPPVDLSSKNQFTVIHYENLAKPGKGISLLQSSEEKERSGVAITEVEEGRDSALGSLPSVPDESLDLSSSTTNSSTYYPVEGPGSVDTLSRSLHDKPVSLEINMSKPTTDSLSPTVVMDGDDDSRNSSYCSPPVISRIIGQDLDSSPDEMTPLIADPASSATDTSVVLDQAASQPSFSYKAFKVDAISSSVYLSKAKIAAYIPDVSPDELSSIQEAEETELGPTTSTESLTALCSAIDTWSVEQDQPGSWKVKSSEPARHVIISNEQTLPEALNGHNAKESTAAASIHSYDRKSPSFKRKTTVELFPTTLINSGLDFASVSSNSSPSRISPVRSSPRKNPAADHERVIIRQAGNVQAKNIAAVKEQRGLNQFSSVISKVAHSGCGSSGLNQLQEHSSALYRPTSRHSPSINFSLQTSSRTSSRGSLLSGSTSPGSYIVASYDDGTEVMDDSLLWVNESFEESGLDSVIDSWPLDFGDLELNSTWMTDLPEHLINLPLTSLAIPGSHISLAIQRDLRVDMDIAPCNYEMAEFLRTLPNLGVFNNFRALIKDIWKVWMPKQILSLTQQLLAGVRYLDIRVTRFNDTIYAEHGLYARELIYYLGQIRQFLEAHPREIVLLHFNSLGQILPKDKRRLVTTLFQVFGSRLMKVCDPKQLTLKRFWEKKKQLIIIFPKKDVEELSTHMFAGLIWPDSLCIGQEPMADASFDFRAYLDLCYNRDVESSKPRAFHVLRAALVPDMSMVFGEYEHESVIDLTKKEIHPQLSLWLNGKENVNIIAFDFVGGTGLIGKILLLNNLKQ